MLAYRPVYRPVMAQVTPPPGGPVTPPPETQIVSYQTRPETLMWAALLGTAAYAGIKTGLRDKGVASAAGWVGGITTGILGLMALANVVAPRTFEGSPIAFRIF